MNRRYSGLWNHPDFMKLWIGQTISAFGSRISRDGLPLTAVMILQATPQQMGLLVALASLPALLLGLPIGVWVDRQRRRPLMMAADIGRMLLLLTIPAAALSGHLSMSLLYAMIVLISALSLLFDVAYRSVLPSLVERQHVLEGNSKLAASDSLAEIGGPVLAGALIQAITAPLAVFFDALSFLFSAISLATIRQPEPLPVPHEGRRSLRRDLVEGGQAIAAHPVLRKLVIAMTARSFFGSFFGALYGYYVIRDLGLSPAALGVLVGAGGVGALVGALLSGWLPKRFGLGRTLTLTLLGGSVIGLLTPLAGGPPLLAAAMLLVGQLINDALMEVYLINDLSLRQTLVPDRLLGRANATVGFLGQGIGSIGALVAGGLAGVIGARLTLLIAVLGGLSAALALAASPVRDWRMQPEG